MRELASQKGSYLLGLLPAVSGVVLSAFVAYGAAQVKHGELTNKVSTLEKQQEQTVTIRELDMRMQAQNEKLDLHMRNVTQHLEEINTRLRDIQKEVRERK